MKLFTKPGCLGCDHAICDECSPPNVTLRPIDMLLYCPQCGLQHVDAPEEQPEAQPGDSMGAEGAIGRVFDKWANPPHRSHLCHGCGHIWRPADVPTNGVERINTRGQNDSPPVHPYTQVLEQAGNQIWWSIQFCNGDPTLVPIFSAR